MSDYVTTEGFSHLTLAAYRLLDASRESRKTWIDTARYVEYPRGEEIIGALRWRLGLPSGPRPPCISIGGESGMGKTHLVIELHKRMGIDPESGANARGERPVLYFDGAGIANRGQFIARFNQSVGVYSRKHNDVDLACAALRRSGVRMVIIDEAHDLRRLKSDFSMVMSDIKHISNLIQRPIALLGDLDVLNIARDDRHLHSRFQNWELTRWESPVLLSTFVSGFLASLPLRAPSPINDEATMSALITATAGNTERVTYAIRSAARRAIDQNLSCINRELLRDALERPF